MSLLYEIEKVLENVRTRLSGKVEAEVMGDVHAIIDEGKAQAGQLLREAGADVKADVATVAQDASQVAADAGAAVQDPTPPAAG